MRDRHAAELDHTRSAAPIRRRLTHLLPAAGLLLAASGSAGAQSSGLYDTSRVLEHLGNECGGQSSCITVEAKQQRVAPGQRDVFRVRCPRNHPHVVGWDTEQHEHITTRVVRDGLPSIPDGAFTRTPTPEGVLRVVAENHADAVGIVTIFLGCSAEPSRATSFVHMRGGVPSSIVPGTGR